MTESIFNVKTITGCDDCPMCDANDICAGYTCNLNIGVIIKESKKRIPITPKWCPIKKKPLIVKYA
jgi:hypothetical protein